MANSDHLYVSFLCISDFNSYGNSVFRFLLVFVDTDFLRNFFNAFCAYGSCDSICIRYIHNLFDGQSNSFTGSDNCWGTSFSRFNYINNRTVMSGFRMTISRSRMVDRSRGRVSIAS